ncbi:MAG: hypothetical protein AAFV53_18440 [Myxococcota bacterium]
MTGTFPWAEALAALSIGSAAMLCVSALLVPGVIARLPEDALIRPPPQRSVGQMIGRNLVGGLLVLFGVIMLFTPGQGVLTILAGGLLVDFPGRPAAMRWFLKRKATGRVLNGIRQRRGRPPLRLPDEETELEETEIIDD